MVCSGVLEGGSGSEGRKQLLVAVASVQVLVGALDVSANEVNLAAFNSDGSRVQGNLVVHVHRSLLKLASFQFVDLDVSLVPLERVQSLGNVGHERVLHVVVQPQVRLHQVLEIPHNFVLIFVKESF